MRACYVMTWIQNGEFMFYYPRCCRTEYVIQMWVDSCLNFLPEQCSDNRLFKGNRLVARQATYQGV